MMNKIIITLVIVASISFAFAVDAVEIKANQPGKIIIEVAIDTAWVSEKDNKIYTIPSLDSYFNPGLPQIPYFQDVLLGVPSNSQTTIFKSEKLSLGKYDPIITGPNKAKGVEYTVPIKTHFDGFFPKSEVELNQTLSLNNLTNTKLKIFPFKIENGNLYYHRNMSVQIFLDVSNQSKPAKLLSKTNYNEIQASIRLKKPSTNTIPAYQFSNNIAKIVVDSSAWYKITGSELLTNGINLLNSDPATIRLWHKAEELPLYIESTSSSGFGSDDIVVFRGERNPAPKGADYDYNFYTSDNVYWLTWGAEPGLRFDEIDVSPNLPAGEVIAPDFFIDTLKIDKKNVYSRLNYSDNYISQNWDVVDHYFTSGRNTNSNTRYVSFDILNPVTSNPLGFKIELNLVGWTFVEHHLNINLNNYDLFDVAWSGQTWLHTNEINSDSYSNNILINGTNLLKLNLIGGNKNSTTQLNWFRLIYPKYYIANNDFLEFNSDITSNKKFEFNISGFSSSDILIFKNKAILCKNAALVPTNQNNYNVIFQDDPSNKKYNIIAKNVLSDVKQISKEEPINLILANIQNNYVAIAPDSFKQILNPLVRLRNGTFVDVDEIYRQYNYGILSPYAIKDFFSDLYNSNNLEYALIAMEPKGGGNIPAIPAMHVFVAQWGEVISDYWYTLLTDDDIIPEIAVGRFPVTDKAELQIMVNKTIYHETREPATWDNNSLLIGGAGSRFTNESEELSKNIIKSGSFLSRVYVAADLTSNFYYDETDTLLSHFERGLSYVNYLGHGGAFVWSDALILAKEDIENNRIRNGNKLPFVTSMTCFTGFLNKLRPNDNRAEVSLGRHMLSSPYGGAIGWFGSAGLGWAYEDFQKAKILQRILFLGESLTVGELINKTKVEFYLNSSQSLFDISQMYQFNLIGDPAVRLKRPRPTSISISPADPQAGDELDLDTAVAPTDSVYYQLFLPDNYSKNQPSYTNSGFPTTATLSDTLKKGLHKLNTGFKSNEELYNSSSVVNVGGSYVVIQSIIPTVITNCDLIDVVAEVIDRDGVSKVQLIVNGVIEFDMVNTSGNLYSLSNLIPPQPSGSKLNFGCRVIDTNNDTTLSEIVSADVYDVPDVVPLSGKFNVDGQISMIIDVESKTTTPIEVEVELLVNKNEQWELVGKDTLEFNEIGIEEARISGFYPYGTNTYKVVTIVDFTCSPTDDNTVTFDLETFAFWVTPTHGSTDNGISHSKIGISNIEIDIPAGAITQPNIMQITPMTNIEVPAQPEFSVNQTGREYVGLEVNWPNGTNYEINWAIGKSDVLSNYKLYKYFTEKRIWLPINYSAITDSTINFKANSGLEIFTFLANTDFVAPVVNETLINGRKFLRNSYLGSNPMLQFNVYDKNGIDFRPDSITYLLNNSVIDNISQDISGTGNNLNINIAPTLTELDSTLSLIIQDAAGNVSDTLRLYFMVSENLDIIDYGNFPNPFSNTTVFSFDLSETVDELSIDIYTVRGRKIRSLNQESSQTSSDITLGGFHEIIWEGKDDWGKLVGNGVYFYILQAKKGKNKIEKIGKIVVSR